MTTRLGTMIVLWLACPALAVAQRAQIVGRVADPSGAVIPEAEISLRNVETGIKYPTRTNESGHYSVPFLAPGNYEIAVQKTGFRPVSRTGITLEAGQVLRLDFVLDVAQVTEVVEVSAPVPLMATDTASVGMVFESKTLSEVPLRGGGIYGVLRLLAMPTVRALTSVIDPTTAQAGVQMSVAGSKDQRIEVTVDEMPQMFGGFPAKMVPTEAVEEFRVEIFPVDASIGHTSGGIANATLRSGTNELHGRLWEHHSNRAMTAMNYFAKQWLNDPATGPVTPEKKAQAETRNVWNRYGVTLGGPVVLPGLYQGRNRSFWAFTWEGFRRAQSGGSLLTVPTSAQRQGNFSDLLRLGSQYQIYDPATAQLGPQLRVRRDPFPGNIIPSSRLDPVARRLLTHWPLPNTAGSADGRANYFSPNPFWTWANSHNVKLDHHVSERHRLSASLFFWDQFFTEPAEQYFYRHSKATGRGTDDTVRRGSLDYVYVLSPRSVLNVRGGRNYMIRRTNPWSQGLDLTSLGFPAALAALAGPDGAHFPQLAVDAYATLGSVSRSHSAHDIMVGAVNFSRMLGQHSIRTGVDLRALRWNTYSRGNAAPRFDFTTTYTRGPLDNSPASPIGQGLASFLLGLPTGGGIDRNAAYSEQTVYRGFYFQDDFRLTPRLTLNLGLRYEYEGPTTERYNRSIRRFLEEVPNPIEPLARANYAAAPLPEIPLERFRVMGGLTFAGVGGEPRTLWQGDRNNWAPRLGFAYSLNQRTVLRGGYVVLYDQLGVDRRHVVQTGFSQRTLIVPSLDNGLTFRANLQHPFPEGLQEPPGASLGLRTFLGRGISYFYPQPQAPRMQRWMLSLQRELPGQVAVELAYVGNRGSSLATTRDINPTPRQYLSTAPFRDQAVIDYLTAQVRNPFFGMPEFAGTSLAGRTVARMQLLRPFPHFGGAVSASRPLGSSWYHSLQLRSRRRFANGWSYQAAYTWSKLIEADTFLNPTDLDPHRVISSLDRPHRAAVAGIWELPLGKGRKWGSDWRGLPQVVLGGWQLQGMYNAQSGEALSFGNVLFIGDIKDIPLPPEQRSLSRWFNTEAGFERDPRKQLANNIRTFPLRLAGVRAPGVHVLDLALVKLFQIRERLRMELRGDLYNVFNHIDPQAPDTSPTSSLFGRITASKGGAAARWLWLAAKISF